MNIIKLILAVIGLIFVGMLLLWVVGFLSSIIWYLFWIGVLGALGYGGYKLFRKLEDKTLGSGSAGNSLGGGVDIPMSWDEYDKKYLHK
jgi:hypothetical protein